MLDSSNSQYSQIWLQLLKVNGCKILNSTECIENLNSFESIDISEMKLPNCQEWDLPPAQCIAFSFAISGKFPTEYQKELTTESKSFVLLLGLPPYKGLPGPENEQFYQLVARQIHSILSKIRLCFQSPLVNAHGREAERKKLEFLAELDRAKNIFFTNISHEFRTPLTLILGFVEQLEVLSANSQRINFFESKNKNQNLFKMN